MAIFLFIYIISFDGISENFEFILKRNPRNRLAKSQIETKICGLVWRMIITVR